MSKQDPREFEQKKIKGAVRTDFILSAEIVAITLGIVSDAPLLSQVLILSGIAIVVTVGVYGIVAAIVKLDDLGYWLREKTSRLAQAFGGFLLAMAPWLMKILSVVGTIAMFLVGGGIVVHGITPLHHLIEEITADFGGLISALLSNGANLVLGFIIGSIVLLGVNLIAKLRGKSV